MQSLAYVLPAGLDMGVADPRAALVVRLLLQGVDSPSPSFTHLLMGYDCECDRLCV